MRKTVIFLVSVMFCLYQITMAQDITKLDAVLQQEMEFHPKSEKLRINIILNAQYDQMELRSKANAFKSKETKRSFVVNELKVFSKETQRNLMSILNDLASVSAVSDIQSFWISNSLFCYATVSAIEELSYHPDILVIGLDVEQYLIPNTTISTQEEPTREITYNVLKVQANEVWELGYTGEGIVVSVLDTGVNYDHLDLQGNMWEHPDYPFHGYNYVSNNNNPKDDHGHGSHCAGTVAGHGAAGSETAVAPQAKIMAVKVMNAQGGGNLSWVINGIQFSVENGADVLSLSLGFPGGGGQYERTQMRNSMNNVLEAGIIAAVAAGNDGDRLWMYPVPNNIGSPGNCPPPWLHPDQTLEGGVSAVVCVGSTNQNDQIAYDSSRGPVTWASIPGYNDYAYNPGIGLIRPDVCAPGVLVRSIRHNSNTGYVSMSGTSMATPCVAGVVALMLSKNPNLTPAEISEILETTAQPLSTTKNNTFGSGRVNALDAINAVSGNCEIVFESLTISNENGKSNEKLKPGETVTLNILLKNESLQQADDVNVTLETDNELIVINQGNAFIELIEEEGTAEIEFNITLLPEAVAFQEIEFILIINLGSEDENKSFCTSNFTVTVYDYLFEITNIVIPNEGTLIAGETTDILIFLKNIGNDDAVEISGTVSTDSPYLIFNENSYSFGDFEIDNNKYGIYNITVSEDIPSETDVSFEMIITDDQSERTIELISTIPFSNTEPSCQPIEDLTAESVASSIILTWTEPTEIVPEKYLIFSNNTFVGETEITTYTHEDVIYGTHNYCVAALYPDECVSEFICTEITGSIEKTEVQILIYPTPAKSTLFIEGNGIKTVTVYNMFGQKVKEVEVINNKVSINTANYSPGLYIAEIETETGYKINRRVVIVR